MNVIETIDAFLPGIFGSIANPILDSFMIFVTGLGDGGVVWVAVIMALLISKKYRKVGIAAAFSLALCFFTGNYLVKPLIGRVRPCNLYPELRMIVPPMTDYSFPSMHTATAFSVASVLVFYNKKMGIPAIVLSVLIALSRVYLNLHFTTDIICGAVYGWAIAYVVDFAVKKLKFDGANY